MKNFLARVKAHRQSYYELLETKLIESSFVEYLDEKDNWLAIGVGYIIVFTTAVVVYAPIYVMSVFKALFNKEGK